LYGEIDRSASALAGKYVRVYSDLGTELRSYLGPPSKSMLFPPKGGVTIGGARVAEHLRVQRAKFVRVPFPRVPPRVLFDELITSALRFGKVRTVDDQRCIDAGIAAEYFLELRSLPSASAPSPAPAPVSASDDSSGLCQLPLARQNVVIKATMLGLMSEELRRLYEQFKTPADILKDISTWESDLLYSAVPLLQDKLRTAAMLQSESPRDFFMRVCAICVDLAVADAPVEQKVAMNVIVNGARLARFDVLRQMYGSQQLRGEELDFWLVLRSYHDLDRINLHLPETDTRHPGWSKAPLPTPVNAAFQRRQEHSRGPGSSKIRPGPCTYGPCPNKKSHSEDRCWAKYPALKEKAKAGNRGKPSGPPVPQHLALPAQPLTTRQLASLQAQIDSFPLQN
jgi:hypothetical protein